MKMLILFTAAMLLAIALPGQTNRLPIFYVHFGIHTGNSAKRLLLRFTFLWTSIMEKRLTTFQSV